MNRDFGRVRGASGTRVAVALGLVLGLAGCTSKAADRNVQPAAYSLVAFDTCADALNGLRTAAEAAVGPYGFGGGRMMSIEDSTGAVPPVARVPGPLNADSGAAGSAAQNSAGKSPADADPTYSGTNSYEPAADEPDLVKTDGHRIVTVSGGVLRVVDATNRRISSTVDLTEPGVASDPVRYTPAELLLSGDHALVLLREVAFAATFDGKAAIATPQPAQVQGVRLILVDLAGGAKVVSRVRTDGNLIDARQVGSTVRIVVKNSPRITFPYPDQPINGQSDVDKLTTANKAVIAGTGMDAWLPRITTTTGTRTSTTDIGCDAVSRPASYSGTSMLTVLSYDASTVDLGDGRPVVLAADGDTVYSTATSLYVTADQRWQPVPAGPAIDDKTTTAGKDAAAKQANAAAKAVAAAARTEIYKFDTSAARPEFVAGGAVPGNLINQYALSEWQGNLRVASTVDGPTRQSGVYVLGQDGSRLTVKGSVQGLGKGEQIYAVRFVGAVGYVVTFKQTDPLYTVDLSDPARPTVRGELALPGYSAYLHPADGNRLIGVGQSATGRGQATGTQVSLFDVGNVAAPARLANFALAGSYSEAEFDPHAFLYWPATGLLVIPLQRSGIVPDVITAPPTAGGGSGTTASGSGGTAVKALPPVGKPAGFALNGALVLKVTGTTITQVGFVSQPGSGDQPDYPPQIRRSVLIGQTLWTVSDTGLMASDANSLARQAWLPFA